MYKITLIFFIMQLVNVILNTIKSLIVAKFDNTHLSAGMNAIAYAFYVSVVKSIANLPLVITMIVTLITNIIGVYISYYLIEKTRKDDLWKVEVYIKEEGKILQQILLQSALGFLIINDKILNVYCYTKNDSRKLKKILKDFNCKINIIKVEKQL